MIMIECLRGRHDEEYEEICYKYEGNVKNNEKNVKKYVDNKRKYEEFFERISRYVQDMRLRKSPPPLYRFKDLEIFRVFHMRDEFEIFKSPPSPLRATEKRNFEI